MPYIVIGGILYHYGIPGMRWGHRRFQNKDGTLTEAGKRRYAKQILTKGGTETTADKAKTISRDIASDIARHDMLGVEAQLESAMSIRSRLDDLKKIDQECMNSKEVKKAFDRAYDDALTQYEEDYPDKFAEAVKANNGSTDLLELSDPFFDIELLERQANYVDEARSKWYANRRGSVTEDSLHDTEMKYRAACRELTNELLGEYGSAPVTVDMGRYNLKTSLNYYMDEVVSLMTYTPLDQLRKDK